MKITKNFIYSKKKQKLETKAEKKQNEKVIMMGKNEDRKEILIKNKN